MNTAHPELMRAINTYLVLNEIRKHRRIARVEIATRTMLSRATVSAIVDALIGDGLINDCGESGSGGQRGRPRAYLELNPAAAHVGGVKISQHQISVAVTNFIGDVLCSLILPVRTGRQSPEVLADIVEDGIRRVMNDCGVELNRLSGVCVGIPGFIDSIHGISYWSPVLGKEPVPFGTLLGNRLKVLTFIENDANMVTLAEQWFGRGQDVDTFLVVTVEHGVGMGLVVNGDLYRGARGFGAEFGHTKLDRNGPPCRCGQQGCIEAYVADYAILREAARFIDIPEAMDPISQNKAIQMVTERARAGDDRLREVFVRAGEALGVGIANLINILNPSRVIISGEGLRADDLLIDAVMRAAAAHTISAERNKTEIFVHKWGDDVWARGAAALVLQHMYHHPLSQTRPPENASPSPNA